MLKVNNEEIEKKIGNIVEIPYITNQDKLNIFLSYKKGKEDKIVIKLKFKFKDKEYYVFSSYDYIDEREIEETSNVILKFKDLPYCDNLYIEIVYAKSLGYSDVSKVDLSELGDIEIFTKK